MSVKITYFVHGTAEGNELKLSQGWTDTSLTERGLGEAKKLGELMKDVSFDAVISSDLKRAFDTATIAFGDRHEIIKDERIRECNYGDHNNGPKAVVGPLKKKVNTPFPNGESYEMVKDRVADLLKEIKEKYDGKHIAFVAHQAPQLALEVLLNDKTWEEAFDTDWRNTGAWQPGWEYTLK